MENKTVTIILVEDDLGHARLIEKNLKRTEIENQIMKFTDGQQAIDYLFSGKNRSFAYPTTPMLILLDLNLPILDGFAVLKLLKENEMSKHVPVIMMTTTDNTHEINKCYELGCNLYLVKPVEYLEFAETIRKLGLFLSMIKIP
jgi:DNA-binding response OmpR family regulator